MEFPFNPGDELLGDGTPLAWTPGEASSLPLVGYAPHTADGDTPQGEEASAGQDPASLAMAAHLSPPAPLPPVGDGEHQTRAGGGAGGRGSSRRRRRVGGSAHVVARKRPRGDGGGSGGGGNGGKASLPPFIESLYTMLNQDENREFIKWSDDGTAFVIAPDKLPSVLGKHFRHNNTSSFVRQLNMYAFRKVPNQQNMYSNPNFRRGAPELLHNIKRKNHVEKRITASQGALSSRVQDISQEQQTIASQLSMMQHNQSAFIARLQQLEEDKRQLQAELARSQADTAETRKGLQNLVSFIQQVIEQQRAGSKRRRLISNRAADSPLLAPASPSDTERFVDMLWQANTPTAAENSNIVLWNSPTSASSPLAGAASPPQGASPPAHALDELLVHDALDSGPLTVDVHKEGDGPHSSATPHVPGADGAGADAGAGAGADGADGAEAGEHVGDKGGLASLLSQEF